MAVEYLQNLLFSAFPRLAAANIAMHRVKSARAVMAARRGLAGARRGADWRYSPRPPAALSTARPPNPPRTRQTHHMQFSIVKGFVDNCVETRLRALEAVEYCRSNYTRKVIVLMLGHRVSGGDLLFLMDQQRSRIPVSQRGAEAVSRYPRPPPMISERRKFTLILHISAARPVITSI
ncbi:hypothetical protein RR46_03616 [Papilio xuthus]|uniref:Uncharacterized protein n=1 Tax=Papilio xuthus TaxID=66420 RepID=A0A194Q0E3_PAPXU|nr:hypothetical protein RR46_03616 [Papilio xuthus]